MSNEIKPIGITKETQETSEKEKTKYDVIFIRIPADLKNRLDTQAERLNMTRNSVMRLAIVKWVEEEEHVQKVREREIENPHDRQFIEKVVTLVNPLG